MNFAIETLEEKLEYLNDLLKFEKGKLRFKRLPLNYDNDYNVVVDSEPNNKYSIAETKHYQACARKSIIYINIAKGEILEAIQILKEDE